MKFWAKEIGFLGEGLRSQFLWQQHTLPWGLTLSTPDMLPGLWVYLLSSLLSSGSSLHWAQDQSVPELTFLATISRLRSAAPLPGQLLRELTDPHHRDSRVTRRLSGSFSGPRSGGTSHWNCKPLVFSHLKYYMGLTPSFMSLWERERQM